MLTQVERAADLGVAGWAVWAWMGFPGPMPVSLYTGALVFIGNMLLFGWMAWKDAERRDLEHERFLVQKSPSPQ